MNSTSSAPPEHVIDARTWEPPEPFVATMEALDTMQPHERVLLILNREPHPLYRALLKQGFCYQTTFNDDTGFEILIWREGA